MSYAIAIVGLGPRGVYALEALATVLNRASPDKPLTLKLFDDSGYPGCGPWYRPDQSPLNLLNIPCREVPLEARAASSGYVDIAAFPGYRQWQQEEPESDAYGYDIFPARASIGRYLQSRFESWLEGWQAVHDAEFTSRAIVAVRRETSGLVLVDDHGDRHEHLSQVLLTIGHQPVERDPSLQRWFSHACDSESIALYEHPYPTETLISAEDIGADANVAIRGMGLSMIDVVKCLTEGRGGQFSPKDQHGLQLQYTRSSREPALLLPFSLDGLPMAPKPMNEAFDRVFAPTDAEKTTLETMLEEACQSPTGEVLKTRVVESVATLAASVYQRLGDRRAESREPTSSLTALVTRWLQDETIEHAGLLSHGLSSQTALRYFIDMASDRAPISADFCVGQVWRHCQPQFYRTLTHAGAEAALLVPFIELDQRMKRYAFGPPVGSVARLLALCDAGLVRFMVSDDPDIELCDNGWTLTEDEQSVTVPVMVNTVLDSPSVQTVTSSLVASLHDQKVLVPVDSALGAQTDRVGRVVSSHPITMDRKLSLIGRLAIGSVVEADALIECFGPELDVWAESVVKDFDHV